MTTVTSQAAGVWQSFVPKLVTTLRATRLRRNMSEIDHFRHLMRAPVGDRVILILTFVLTVLIDLAVAIGVGVVLAALMFMHRMAEVSAIRNRVALDDEEESTTGASTLRDFIDRCKERCIPVYIAGLSKSVAATLRDMHALARENATMFAMFDVAVAHAAAEANR